ncbi:DUF4283 domain protein [Trifolium medium]|uniref:DUF4283 domain protein n=1 Tax=Trifolium medium TaxID=97028 RepID=A0A392MPG7_9FABA|nr:DUF4283 domain protein [Trifolium medium]
MAVPVPVSNQTEGRVDEIPILEAEVEEEFLQTLIGSYVGKLRQSVEVRAIQMKLGLAGLQDVKVAEMGGSLILLSRVTCVEVGAPVNNLDWWEGLLEDVKPWTPNQVSSRRNLWVRVYGLPLHIWGVKTFQMIADRCGAFLAMDNGTMQRNQFDFARIHIESDLLGYIDFVIRIRVQGAIYKVRVVEEGVGPRELESLVVDDQLGWSVAASSCQSGGGGPAQAVLDWLDGDDSDSQASEGCQQEQDQPLHVVTESTVDGAILEDDGADALDNTTLRVSIPSNVEKEIVTEELFVPEVDVWL